MGLLRKMVATTGVLLVMGAAIQTAAHKGQEQQRTAIVAQAQIDLQGVRNSIRDSTHYVAKNQRTPELSLKIAYNSFKEAEKALREFKQGMPHTNQANIQTMRWIGRDLIDLAKAVEKIDIGGKDRTIDQITRLATDITQVAR